MKHYPLVALRRDPLGGKENTRAARPTPGSFSSDMKSAISRRTQSQAERINDMAAERAPGCPSAGGEHGCPRCAAGLAMAIRDPTEARPRVIGLHRIDAAPPRQEQAYDDC